MAKARTAAPPSNAITSLVVSGFKSIVERTELDIRPLTLLAGANSSGKSSIMQPLLLWKQTLEASYDPGPLLLNGPNVRFTSYDQIWPRTRKAASSSFVIGACTEKSRTEVDYKRTAEGVDIALTINGREGRSVRWTPNMTSEEVVIEFTKEAPPTARKTMASMGPWSIGRDRTQLSPRNKSGGFPFESFTNSAVRSVIHISGLRGNPQRTYPVTAIGDKFPGTFEPYAASVIAHWEARKDDNLARVAESLQKLGLTWKVSATRIDDTQVELKVGRTPRPTRGARDLVSIADVGFGVSQSLPILVALLAAEPGQLAFIEQPEIHLHPRAQTILAEILADAARRGVRVVAETHSSLLLLAVQTLVAEGKLDKDLVALHWFVRDNEGATQVKSAVLDDAGAFGANWPEDFGEVALQAESRFLDAQEARRRKRRKKS